MGTPRCCRYLLELQPSPLPGCCLSARCLCCSIRVLSIECCRGCGAVPIGPISLLPLSCLPWVSWALRLWEIWSCHTTNSKRTNFHMRSLRNCRCVYRIASCYASVTVQSITPFRRWVGPGGSRGLQSRCEARRTSRVCSIRTHLRQEMQRSPNGLLFVRMLFRASALSCSIDGRLRCGLGVTVVLFVLHCLPYRFKAITPVRGRLRRGV